MFVDSDDEDDFKDDVQQYVHSRDWDEEISDEEDEDDTDTVVELPTGNDSGDFSLGDVKASLISSSEESKRQPLSDMFTTYLGYDEEVKEQQRRMKRNQPPAGDFGCSDPEMSGPEWDSDEGTVVDEQEEAFHGEIDEESGEIVVECEEDGVEESDEIVIPFNAQVAIREIPLNSNEDEAVVPATKEISREAIDEDVISADFENEKPVSLLDELLFSPIPLSSPKVVDIDEVAPFLGEDMSTLAPKQNIEIVLPIQEKEENSSDMSFLDSLLSSPMVISTPKVEEEQEDVPDPIPKNSFVPPGYRDFEYDPETSQVNVWESKRQVYGCDYYLESAGVVSFQKNVNSLKKGTELSPTGTITCF